MECLRIENLFKRYNTGFTLEIKQLEFQTNKTYSIVGPNGAGKTTLLKIISFLEWPDNGKIFYNGQEINDAGARLNIRRKMCMITENPLLFRTTVFKNITSGLKFHSIDRKQWSYLSEIALKIVGLEGFDKRYAYTLSRGETQRVAIARALALNPEVLLLDEPFTNIDKMNVNIIEKIIKTLNTTVIFTTHDFAQAYRLADEVISIIDGKAIKGSIENLFLGDIEEVNGSKFVKIAPSVKVAVITEKKDRTYISIAPQDIIISHLPLESSARNSFSGIIKGIQVECQLVKLFVDIGVEIVVLITMDSYSSMQLFVGSTIFLTFKTTSVAVL